MGLFDRFKKKAVSDASARAGSIATEASADVLSAPVSGRVVAISEVPDPIFSSEVLGKGCTVWPSDDTVYSPVTGSVTVTMGHAAGIAGDNGIEVLVHIGVDTVDMGGDGFTGFVRQGDRVEAGQPLIRMDRAKIEAAGHPDCVVVAVSNTAEFAEVALVPEAGSEVSAGAALLRVSR